MNYLVIREKLLSKLVSGLPTRGTLEQFAQACDCEPAQIDGLVQDLVEDGLVEFGKSRFDPEAFTLTLQPVVFFQPVMELV